MIQPRPARDALDDEAWSRSFGGEHDADSAVSGPPWGGYGGRAIWPAGPDGNHTTQGTSTDAMTTSKVARKMRKLRKAEPANRHVRLYRWELESAAYRSLSVRARCLLIELKALYNGANNGELFLSVRDAAARLKTCLHQATAASASLKIVASSSHASAAHSNGNSGTQPPGC
jgi:hypothetical protein